METAFMQSLANSMNPMNGMIIKMGNAQLEELEIKTARSRREFVKEIEADLETEKGKTNPSAAVIKSCEDLIKKYLR